MKLPAWFNAEVARLGKQCVAEDITRDEAATQLSDLAFRKENRLFLHDIVHTWMLARVRSWVQGFMASLSIEEIEAATGQLPLPFPDLPALLEIRPGRFVHQNAVTRIDLKAAVVQADTKASNAAGFAQKVRRLAEAALPLMTDDTITLSAIAEKLRLPVGAPVPS